MLLAAQASGAQRISTDPQVGMTGRYDSDYVARLPEGSRHAATRCGRGCPIGAPRAADERQTLNQPAAAS